MVSQTAQAHAAAERGGLVFPLPWLLDHTVTLYCHKHVRPWGGLHQSWVKVKPGWGRRVYSWLGTVFAWFAGWAFRSAQGRRSDCVFHHQHLLALCNYKASLSTGAVKPLPDLLSSREQASIHARRNGSAGSDWGSIQLSQSNLLTHAFGGQQDSKVSRDMSKNSRTAA